MENNDFGYKVKERDELASVLADLRAEGKRVVFTNGCFDILHAGHCTYLELARGAGDLLVVALNSDESVRQLKGDGRPIVPLSERMEVLSAFEFVDYVTSFDELDPLAIIMELKPDVLIKGSDWSIDRVIGREFVEANGGEVRTIPVVEGLSSTDIIDRIVKGG